MNLKKRLKKLSKQKRTMVRYLKEKLKNEDWHGVQDAASDLRDIEAAVEAFESLLEEPVVEFI